jgi:FkbH-like protein
MKTCLVLSDFNISNFNALLSNHGDLPSLRVIEAPFGEVHSKIVDDMSACWSEKIDVVVVWTLPQSVIHSYNHVLMSEKVNAYKLMEEVDQYTDLLLTLRSRADVVLVPTWATPSYDRGLGLLNFQHELGARNLLSMMNLRLAEKLSKLSNFFLLDTQRWIESIGSRSFSPKLWYMAKIAFGIDVFKKAADEVKIALRAIGGHAKKLIILDLDNTLWGGIVGDVGKDNIILGGHDAEGEAFVDFQRSLKALSNRGILLGIVSKNEESTALDAIQSHPEMVLKMEDFAGWRINWQDKAENVIELVSDLNLGLEAVVFIDDNLAERARVREALPDVYVPEWPHDICLYRKTLQELTCFDTPYVGEEDRQRTAMYVSERQRSGLRAQLNSLEDWLKSLEMRLTVEALTKSNLPRVAQLLNKTNQMNLSTRRLSEADLLCWATSKDNYIWTLRVADRFGDSGLTGLVSAHRDGNTLKIVDFVLSCRVFSRDIESYMIELVVEKARNLGCRYVIAEYVDNNKNKPTLEFFIKSGMRRISQKYFCIFVSRYVRKIYHYEVSNNNG